MLKLDNRLQAVLNEINNAETLADIGCDHGKLIVSAITLGKAKHGIAVDISADSLKKTRILAEKYNIADKLEFIVGDGFLSINNSIDVAVISGMGGREIVKILSQKDSQAKKYILVPHQDAHILRRYLKESHFTAIKDFIVQEHKFYPVIVVEKGCNNYSDKEIYLGKNTPSSEAYSKWILERYKIIKEIIDKAGQDAIESDLKGEWEVLKEWQN